MTDVVIPVWSLADRLRKIRRDQNFTQKEFAKTLGVKPPTYEGWESGRNRPSDADAVAIAVSIEHHFGVPLSWTLAELFAVAEELLRVQRRGYR